MSATVKMKKAKVTFQSWISENTRQEPFAAPPENDFEPVGGFILSLERNSVMCFHFGNTERVDGI